MQNREVKVCTLKQAQEVEKGLLNLLKALKYDEQDIFGIRLALEEAIINAIKHGHKFDETKTAKISYAVDDKQVAIEITDQGIGFAPCEVPDPRADENLEKPSGRGLMLMKAYMDEVKFSRSGNRVVMIKRRKND